MVSFFLWRSPELLEIGRYIKVKDPAVSRNKSLNNRKIWILLLPSPPPFPVKNILELKSKLVDISAKPFRIPLLFGCWFTVEGYSPLFFSPSSKAAKAPNCPSFRKLQICSLVWSLFVPAICRRDGSGGVFGLCIRLSLRCGSGDEAWVDTSVSIWRFIVTVIFLLGFERPRFRRRVTFCSPEKWPKRRRNRRGSEPPAIHPGSWISSPSLAFCLATKLSLPLATAF